MQPTPSKAPNAGACSTATGLLAIDPTHARMPAAMPPRQPSSPPPSPLPSSSPATAAVQRPPPGAPSSCLPADQSCFTVSAVSVGAPAYSRTGTRAAACCSTTSYITVLGISFGSLLVILLILCAIRWYLVRRSASRDAAAAAAAGATAAAGDPEKKQPKGLNADAIAALPEFVYRKAEGAGGEEEEEERELECAVCLGAMADGDAARRLPSCTHVFHRGCVDVWLRERSTCPVCRGEVDVVRSSGEGGDGKDDQEGGGPPSLASTSMAWTALEEFVDDGERDLEAQL